MNEFFEDLEDDAIDVEPYEGEPEFDRSEADENGNQDVTDIIASVSFFARAATGFNNWRETLKWYKTHQTTSQIGFNPDGMCLKVCRTARNIPARYSSAKLAQDATPAEHRVHKVRDLRKGMVGYFDDPNDSNKFGHIATMVGRVKGFDPDSLYDTLWETNSVKSGELVIVRGDYFERYWGDKFRFGATWLNGQVLDAPNAGSKVERFHDSGPKYNLRLLERAGKHRPKPKQALDEIHRLVNQLPDGPKMHRVRQFKVMVRSELVLDLRILDEAVEAGRKGKVRRIRDELRRVVDSLPEE